MRRAYIKVSPLYIAELCKPIKWKALKIESPVPQDALFITAEYCDSEQCFKVIFEHDSFGDIPEGCLIPCLVSPIVTEYHGEWLDLISKEEN